MRRRLGSLAFRFRPKDLVELLNRELGTNISYVSFQYEFKWTDEYVSLDLRDVLDSITIIAQGLGQSKSAFLAEAARIFNEEQVRYKIDDLGGVHFFVDHAFEAVRSSAIMSLAASRYNGVRQQLEAAYNSLDHVPFNGKLALRCIFSSNEALFRLIFPSAPLLGSSEIRKYLKPLLDLRYQDQKPALFFAQKQLNEYTAWVEGLHFYRHESGSEEPVQPPRELAIQSITSGTAWLRWLQAFDQIA